MIISCPHCSFSREVPADRVPPRTTRVLCPQCGERFPWQLPPAGVKSAPAAAPIASGGGEQQGIQRTARPRTPRRDIRQAPAAGAFRETAGFGLRLVAVLIDAVVYSALLAVIVAGLATIIAVAGSERPEARGAMLLLALLVVLCLGTLYRVCFIGYCGQTPGKMATRIKVVRTSGADVGFGAAIFREVIGKFISALLLFCGYLMVLFDERRQGLHDKIADTIVVKL